MLADVTENCTFTQQAYVAMAYGFKGMIINDVGSSGGSVVLMTTDDKDLSFPAVSCTPDLTARLGQLLTDPNVRNINVTVSSTHLTQQLSQANGQQKQPNIQQRASKYACMRACAHLCETFSLLYSPLFHWVQIEPQEAFDFAALTMYTRTAIFIVLCVVIVLFMSSVYCQHGFRRIFCIQRVGTGVCAPDRRERERERERECVCVCVCE